MNRAQKPFYAPVAALPPGYGEALALLGLIDRTLWIYDFDKTAIIWANAQGSPSGARRALPNWPRARFQPGWSGHRRTA